MTKELINSLFFNPKENPFKDKKSTLNLDMVEATINQVIAEINEQKKHNKQVISTYSDTHKRQELAYAQGYNSGLKTALIMLRRLKSDILWKQLTLNNNENE